MQASPGLPSRVSFVEMALDQFFHHLDEFFEGSPMRGHVGIFADGNKHSVFFMDVEVKFHSDFWCGPRTIPDQSRLYRAEGAAFARTALLANPGLSRLGSS